MAETVLRHDGVGFDEKGEERMRRKSSESERAERQKGGTLKTGGGGRGRESRDFN